MPCTPSPARRAGARLLVGGALTLGLLAAPAVARAQSITALLAQSPPRFTPTGASVEKRALALRPEGISLRDCQEGLEVEYSLQVSGFVAGQVLQVWAGTADCANQDNRLGATTQKCWQVVQSKAPGQLVVFRVPVRSMLYGLYPDRAPLATAIVPNDPAVCGTVDLQTLQLYFLLVQGVEVKGQLKLDVQADTVGPARLDGLSLLPGNARIHARWNAIGEGGLSDLTGVRMYCAPTSSADASVTTTRNVCTTAPAPVPDATIDETGDAAPFTGDAGVVDAGCRDEEVQAACDETAFGGAAGDLPIIDRAFEDRYECGAVGGNFGSTVEASSIGKGGQVQAIQNYRPYSVFVVATDSFGNPGSPSDVLCMTPEETEDFWDQYRKAGGQAGGCALSETGSPSGALAAGGGALAFVLARLARRRRS